MKLAGCFQLSGATGAASYVLLQFITSVIRQLVIDMQQNIFLNPFAFHSVTPTTMGSWLFAWTGETPATLRTVFIACPPESHATSEWPGIKYFLPFLPSYSKSRLRSLISIPDNASTQRPCARAALVCPERG